MRLTSLMLLGAVVCSAAAPVKIVLVGDSTINPEGGWGPGFRASFSNGIEVVNLAANGRSSKSFRAEGRWAKAIAEKPDYIIMAFGHNDVAGKGPDRETDPKTTYRDNMIRYVEEAKAAGAIPVLATSIVRRSFDAEGKFKPDTLVPYVEETRTIAREKNIPLLDMYSLTLAQAEKLGNAGCEAQVGAIDKDGKPDHTHLGPKGQASIGAMAAKAFAQAFPKFEPMRHELVTWKEAMRQKPDWYFSQEAIRIANNILDYQHENGGWEKNIDMALPLESPAREKVLARQKLGETTIDNDATWTQMRYLAKVHLNVKDERYATAVRKGMSYLLAAQYPNGGWPQFYPLRHGYWDHITYNDDAMVGVMEVLLDISKGEDEWSFLGPEDRLKAAEAFERGIQVILKTQVKVNGRLTVWCAQHDEVTLLPAQARKYELPSLSGSESVGVVEMLMLLEHPSRAVIDAVQAAVEWFSKNKITGIAVKVIPAPGTPKGVDRVVVEDKNAPPLWARFYEIGTNKPMFSGRDSVKKYSLAEIEYERRNGYSWYGGRASKLLDQEYPKWMAKWAPGQDARK